MSFFISLVILFVMQFLYFYIADHFNIIDKPNHRSAHKEVTLRGGGVIFPIAFLIFIINHAFHNSIREPFNYLTYGAGMLAICTISFIDDIVDLSSKIRLLVHFLSVTLLLLFLNAFTIWPWWLIPIAYIIIIGILNAYNFMDGINGMTGLYSSITLGALFFINQNIVTFTNIDFIIYPFLGCIVFLFFNYRKKAKCFMGDVGSLGIAFWIISLIGLLIIKTGDYKWILLLAVYGIETCLTIIERIRLKENIFEAHRRHLYQLLVNEKKIDHRIVSTVYALSQLIINIFLLNIDLPYWLYFPIVLVPLIIVYLFVKINLKKSKVGVD